MNQDDVTGQGRESNSNSQGNRGDRAGSSSNGHDPGDAARDSPRWCREILTAETPPDSTDRAFVVGLLVRLVAGEALPDLGSQLLLRDLYRRHVEKGARAVPDLDVWDAGKDTDPIPPREWLLGTVACRAFLTAIFGAGGAGKTSLLILFALSMATGAVLSHERPYGRSRVLLLSFEDGKDELRRRVRAAMMRYGIKPGDVAGHLFLASVQNPALKLATMDEKTRSAAAGELVGAVERAIQRHQPDAIMFDPFVKTHRVPENDNNAIDFVASQLAGLAVEHNIATVVAHHVRKGGDRAGDADAGRGGGALKDAARLVRTAMPMADKEAEAYGIPLDEACQIFRCDGAKANITRLGGPDWYRTVGVELGNATDAYPEGDNVGVVETWEPPATMAGITPGITNKILDEIDAAPPEARFSTHPKATARAAHPIVQRNIPDCDAKRAKAILAAWLKSGLLYEREYQDTEQRKTRKGLFVDAAKRPRTLAEMIEDEDPG